MKSIIVTSALCCIFLLADSIEVLADVSIGKGIFVKKGCNKCHKTTGPAREKTIADQLKKKGPDLWYAGSKFRKEWLARWLQEPIPIRPMAYNSLTEKNPANHPGLAAKAALDVTAYLMTFTSRDVVPGVIDAKKNLKGKVIFTKKMACSGCHQYLKRKKVSGGMTGPSLVNAGDRLSPDWIYAYMSNPRVFKPVKMMPVFAGILTDKEIKLLSSHIASLK